MGGLAPGNELLLGPKLFEPSGYPPCLASGDDSDFWEKSGVLPSVDASCCPNTDATKGGTTTEGLPGLSSANLQSGSREDATPKETAGLL
mmetsp:Transcript_134352/g.268134  ORF Transcript_134352/g.268134 Transcript_134352/m.268134 type:complete len:90 (+) Transcript_134352:339-608(+)|eukprot:CAMPEP_0172680190 /NCGR_PEP_ID=MMETSP1074-20121228/16597_1 /TAXON_ID=2916 /ORGANISM="Ceratium fusus, Strain PA161109" /LENGTH=89 /DNA_ID=CAMNT_0013498477 /DNA_START=249 /DNA_END=518 /DNA_ORIENTATION=-